MKKLESFMKYILLKILLLLRKRNSGTAIPSFNKDSKILFIRLNRIGDALVTTPLLKVLKENLNCRMDILADRKNNFIYINNPHIDNVYTYNKSLTGFRDTVSRINSGHYDVIVDLHDDISTTVSFLLAFSKAPNIFGLNKGNAHIYTKTVPRADAENTHVVNRLLGLISLFGINSTPNTNIVYCINDDIKTKIHQTAIKRFPGKRFLVGINISAGSPARFWGTDKYIKLIKLLSSYNINSLVLCSTRDIKLALGITDNKDNIFYSPSFEEFSAMISELDMLFTPDTSVVHIASAFNIPVFGLYVKYNTADMIWSPYRSDFDCIITEEPTLHNISFKEAADKFIPFLEKYINK